MKMNANNTEEGNKKIILWAFTFFLIAVGIFFGAIWYFYWQYHQTTDDAYGNGNLINVNSPLEGMVVSFYADDTDFVEEGQLLVQLDPTYYQVAYDKALADLAYEALQVKQLYDSVLVNEANVAIRQVAASKARYDYDNRQKLVGSKAISNEDFIHAKDELTISENELKKAEFQLKVSLDAIGSFPIREHPLLKEKEESLKEAYYNLKHTSIYAPSTGYIAERSVNVGQSASRLKSLMSIIPTDYVWVDANFKETQLKYMRVGQPAKVWFDLYGSDVEFDGKVLGIASGSGSVFSLIPPQNATGNWIKIVQRLPVRISLNPEMVKKYPIRLGLSAYVDVDITDQNLPMLQKTIIKTPVSKTKVFDIDMKAIDLIIDEVLQKNGVL